VTEMALQVEQRNGKLGYDNIQNQQNTQKFFAVVPPPDVAIISRFPSKQTEANVASKLQQQKHIRDSL